MSKFVEIGTCVKKMKSMRDAVLDKLPIYLEDSVLLKKCIQSQGLSLIEGKTTINGYQGTKDVDMKIVGLVTTKGYEIGFTKNDDGSYTMVYDPWDKELGEIAQKILLGYNETEVMNVIKNNMYHMRSRKIVSNNEIEIEVKV